MQVGIKCVNALSEWTEVEVVKNGKIHSISFGRDLTKELHEIGDAPERTGGTKIGFLPDTEIFPDPASIRVLQTGSGTRVPERGRHHPTDRRTCRQGRKDPRGDLPRPQRPCRLRRAESLEDRVQPVITFIDEDEESGLRSRSPPVHRRHQREHPCVREQHLQSGRGHAPRRLQEG